MEKNKTALQQGIGLCDKWIGINKELLDAATTDHAITTIHAKVLAYRKIRSELESLLPTERDNIEIAYYDGKQDGKDGMDASLYFDTHFNQPTHKG